MKQAVRRTAKVKKNNLANSNSYKLINYCDKIINFIY